MKKSNLPKEQPPALALRRNLEKLQLELNDNNQRTWGRPRYGIGEEVDGKREADGCYSDGGNYSVFNYTNEDSEIEKKLLTNGSKVEPVPDPLLAPFICNASAPNSSGIHRGEGFSGNALDMSNAKGIEEHKLQRAQQEENQMNFDRLSL